MFEMFKSKKYWAGIILSGIIIGFIFGMIMRPDVEYVNKPVPVVYYFKGGINTTKDINYILEIQSCLKRKSNEFASVLETYDKVGTENLQDKLSEKELLKERYDRGELDLNKSELIKLESDISNLKIIQSYINKYGKTDIRSKIEEDYFNVIQLEKYSFNEIHNYVASIVDTSDLRNQLEEKERELEALLATSELAGELDKDSIEVLNKEIESINKEIIEKEGKEAGIASYSLLLKREEDVNSILKEIGNKFSPKYKSINDFIFKTAGVSKSYFMIYMGSSIIVLILLSIFFKWISRITSSLNLHGLKNWKNKHFERYDSPFIIIIIYIIIIIACIIAFYPLLNVFSVSLRPQNNLFSTTLEIIPKDWTFDNYRYAIVNTRLSLWLKNSLIVSTAVAIIGVVFSASAGYAFSRFRFYGHRPGMIILLVTQMFPAPMLLLPTYVILSKLGLKDQLIGLAIPYTALVVPFGVWLLKGYFDTIPKDIEESAYIDGCSFFSAFTKIIIPLSKPALAIAVLYSWMTAWTEYVIARVIVSQATKQTLPVGLVYLQGEFNTLWGVYSAAALMTSIPVIILFVALSRHLVGGLVLGSVKE